MATTDCSRGDWSWIAIGLARRSGWFGRWVNLNLLHSGDGSTAHFNCVAAVVGAAVALVRNTLGAPQDDRDDDGNDEQEEDDAKHDGRNDALGQGGADDGSDWLSNGSHFDVRGFRDNSADGHGDRVVTVWQILDLALVGGVAERYLYTGDWLALAASLGVEWLDNNFDVGSVGLSAEETSTTDGHDVGGSVESCA